MIKGACPVGWAGWPPDPQPDRGDISERRNMRRRIGALEAARTSCANKRTLHYEQLHFQYMSGSPEGLSFLCHFRNAHFPRTDNRSARKTRFTKMVRRLIFPGRSCRQIEGGSSTCRFDRLVLTLARRPFTWWPLVITARCC